MSREKSILERLRACAADLDGAKGHLPTGEIVDPDLPINDAPEGAVIVKVTDTARCAMVGLLRDAHGKLERLLAEKKAGAFWRGVFADDVKGDREQIERELSDFHFIMEQIPSIYMHVTGGLLSKPNYPASSVIQAADDHLARHANEAIREAMEVVRSTVLEQQYQLEGSGMTNDQINAVLEVIDEHTPEAQE